MPAQTIDAAPRAPVYTAGPVCARTCSRPDAVEATAPSDPAHDARLRKVVIPAIHNGSSRVPHRKSAQDRPGRAERRLAERFPRLPLAQIALAIRKTRISMQCWLILRMRGSAAGRALVVGACHPAEPPAISSDHSFAAGTDRAGASPPLRLAMELWPCRWQSWTCPILRVRTECG